MIRKILLSLVLIASFLPIFPLNEYHITKAAGYTDNTTTISSVYDARIVNIPTVWSINTASGAVDGADLTVGWTCTAVANQYYKYLSVVSVNVTQIATANLTLESAYLQLWVNTHHKDGTWSDQYYALYKGIPDDIDVISFGDFDNYIMYLDNNPRLSDWVSYNEMTDSSNVSFQLNSVGLDWVEACASNVTQRFASFYIITTNQALNYAPSWQSNKFMHTTFGVGGGAHPPTFNYRFLIDNGAPGVSETPNDPYVPDTTGTANVTDIIWITPRCAYSSEGLKFDASGDIGANVTLELVDYQGIVLDSKVDHVRSNGHFFYTFTVPIATNKRVRAIELNSKLASEWGWCTPMPDTDFPMFSISSVDGVYPQYSYPFSAFVVRGNNLMFVHWKTNLTSAEMSSYHLRLWYRGLQSDQAWSESLEQMADYELCADNNTGMMAWRYCIFALDGTQSGFESYGNLIRAIEKPLDFSSNGFYQPLITDASNIELTHTESGYWYLNNVSDGVSIIWDKNNYSANETAHVQINVGIPSQVLGYLNRVGIQILDTSNNVMNTTNATLEDSQDSFSIVLPNVSGIYKGRVTLWNEGTSFTYIVEKSNNVGVGDSGDGDDGSSGGDGSGGGDAGTIVKTISSSITDILKAWGMDNPAGHWMVIFIVMIIAFFIFRKSEVLRVAGPLVILGLGIALTWVETWIFVLLALGAGITIWQLFRKKVAGGGD